jgi:hypothetical protein
VSCCILRFAYIAKMHCGGISGAVLLKGDLEA